MSLNFDPTKATIQFVLVEGREWWVRGNDDVYWRARSEEYLALSPDDQARVLRRENNTLILSQKL